MHCGERTCFCKKRRIYWYTHMCKKYKKYYKYIYIFAGHVYRYIHAQMYIYTNMKLYFNILTLNLYIFYIRDQRTIIIISSVPFMSYFKYAIIFVLVTISSAHNIVQ